MAKKKKLRTRPMPAAINELTWRSKVLLEFLETELKAGCFSPSGQTMESMARLETALDEMELATAAAVANIGPLWTFRH